MKRFLLSLFLVGGTCLHVLACTNLIVGKNASVDGSTIVSYSADSYSLFGYLCHYPAATYPKGTMLDVYDWDTGKYLGQIEQARKTYNVIGNINEYQVTIGETTFGGRPELVDSTGVLDYGSLIYIALQRSRTAKEAINVMTSLVKEYGYYSSGESFTIADPNEIWIMEMIGKGPDAKGAVWVAVRVPDDCISAHANQSRIRQFDLNDKANCLYSPDVISFAREKGYFDGLNKDFSFADAYAPLNFDALRYCEARVWSYYNRFVPGMEAYLPYAKGDVDADPMPLFVKPSRKLSVRDVMDAMRDHYEGTPLDISNDPGAGPYHMPYRPSPLSFELDGKTYFNERPISTQQTGFSFVSQMRAELPDVVGGVFWFGTDDANMTVYTPVYCGTTRVPDCYAKENGDYVTFSWDAAFWVFSWVANMVYPRYSLMIGDVKAEQKRLEDTFFDAQQGIEKVAANLYAASPANARDFLTNYTDMTATAAFDAWKRLGEFLVVKYSDMVVRKMKDGQFERTETGMAAPVVRPNYPEDFLRQVMEVAGDRYLVPSGEKE